MLERAVTIIEDTNSIPEFWFLATVRLGLAKQRSSHLLSGHEGDKVLVDMLHMLAVGLPS